MIHILRTEESKMLAIQQSHLCLVEFHYEEGYFWVADVCDEDYSWWRWVFQLFCSGVAVLCGDTDPIFDYVCFMGDLWYLSAFLNDFPFVLRQVWRNGKIQNLCFESMLCNNFLHFRHQSSQYFFWLYTLSLLVNQSKGKLVFDFEFTCCIFEFFLYKFVRFIKSD